MKTTIFAHKLGYAFIPIMALTTVHPAMVIASGDAPKPCVEILNQVVIELPAGYKLNKFYIQLASKLVQTAPTVLALNEIADYLSHATPSDLRKISNASYTQKISTASLAIPKTFPQSFFDQVIKPFEVGSETDSANLMEEQVKEFYRGKLPLILPPDVLSPEARVVLAYASKDINEGRVPPADIFNETNILKNLRIYVRDLYEKGLLIDFSRLIDSNKKLFLLFATAVAETEVDVDVALNFRHHTSNSVNFREKLGEKLKVGDLTLNEKINMALETVLPENRKSMIRVFNLMLARKKDFNKMDRWHDAGELYLTLLLRDFFVEVSDFQSNNPSRKRIAFIDMWLTSIAPEQESKEYKFMSGAIIQILTGANNQLTDPVKIKMKIEEFLGEIGATVRTVAKLHEKEQIALKKQTYQNLQPPALISRKRKGFSDGVRVSQVSGNLMRRKHEVDSESNLTVISPSATQVTATPQIGSINISTLMDENPLSANQLYFFEKGQVIEYVIFTPSILNSLRQKDFEINPWIVTFLSGVNGNISRQGIERLTSASGLIWEIRVGFTAKRVLISQDKVTKTWRWLDLVDHEKVNEYVKQHRL